MSVDCPKPGCTGTIKNGICPLCDSPAKTEHGATSSVGETGRQQMLTDLKALLEQGDTPTPRESLLKASGDLTSVVPYNFEAWRLHADLLLLALNQIMMRQLQPDPDTRILSIPLHEESLRDAAEAALRQCAHYADSAEQRITLVDEANKVRRQTWF